MRTDAGRGGRRNGKLMNATGGDCRLVDRVRVGENYLYSDLTQWGEGLVRGAVQYRVGYPCTV